ncbi:hypothetical protein AB6A40_009712 [Gnathostoma spinigerum]|uniref:Uncharacterized protein n=1 Tax=Gnathostoma spinigerum TaxID=75299 RepID=A0ABD6ESR9_9BILA
MPRWVRVIFLEYLPLFLIMQRPDRSRSEYRQNYRMRKFQKKMKRCKCRDIFTEHLSLQHFEPGEFVEMSRTKIHYLHDSHMDEIMEDNSLLDARLDCFASEIRTDENTVPQTNNLIGPNEGFCNFLNDDVRKATDAVDYIMEFVKLKDESKKVTYTCQE